MAKYKVLKATPLTGKKGTFNWDAGAEVTELQVGEKDAKELIKKGVLKKIK